jgi:hypothetical protein
MYIIAVIWLILSLPLALDVDREMRKGNNPLRFNIIVNLMIFVKIIINTPFFYILWIRERFTSNK